MHHIFLITVMSMLLTGCLSAPKPQTHQKLAGYQSLKKSCEQTPPQAVRQECAQLITDLNEENRLLDEMQRIKEDTNQEAAYITLADKESILAQKLADDRKLLAQTCQTQIAAIVDSDDLNSVAFCLQFEENSITHHEYSYLKKHAPKFDSNPQYRAYETHYAKKKLNEGIKAMNSGDKRSALNAFKAAYDAGSAEAAYLVGIVYEEKQIKKAIAWHQKALAEGVLLSKLNLARLYLRVKLPDKARGWYLSAAEENNALAQYQLFKMDAKSKSLKRQMEALAWLERSAKNNYPQAQYIYGLQLLKQKNAQEAQLWLEKAYANGISETAGFLGKLYFEEAAYEKAYPLLAKAEARGEANYLLARMYEDGLGIKKNSLLAYRHYKKAHELAHNNYIADMKRLQKKMTKKERQAATYIDKKEAAKAKELAKNCGLPATHKNIAAAKRTVHIVGVAVTPLEEASGFIVYGEDEKRYYIVAPETAPKIKPYTYVDIKAKTTGQAITVSSDSGALQPVYQFHLQKNCINN